MQSTYLLVSVVACITCIGTSYLAHQLLPVAPLDVPPSQMEAAAAFGVSEEESLPTVEPAPAEPQPAVEPAPAEPQPAVESAPPVEAQPVPVESAPEESVQSTDASSIVPEASGVEPVANIEQPPAAEQMSTAPQSDTEGDRTEPPPEYAPADSS